jgi:uncharacterized membrane protein
MRHVRLRQWWADLRSRFWLRPAAMTVASVALALAMVRLEGRIELPGLLGDWVYAGGVGGARDVLGVVASATIGVAGTTFSITVAALSLASNQMGPRLLRNFSRDAGNQYALGSFVATFAYAIVVLRAVHEGSDGDFVPQLAVSGALLLAGVCVGMLVWFLHHVTTSISVDHVVALVQHDLVRALRSLPGRDEGNRTPQGAAEDPGWPGAEPAPLRAHGSGYLRVLDEAALADWAVEQGARLDIAVRPGGFIFPGSVVGHVHPPSLAMAAETALADAMALGVSRNVEQDLEYSVRQMAEVGLRALSSGVNDPFTAMMVLDQLGAGLCEVAQRHLPDGRTGRDGTLRVRRPATDYHGLVDSMFHMLRQAASGQASVMIRLLEVLAAVATVEGDPHRRQVLREHIGLAYRAAVATAADRSAREALAERRRTALAALEQPGGVPQAAGRRAGVVLAG